MNTSVTDSWIIDLAKSYFVGLDTFKASLLLALAAVAGYLVYRYRCSTSRPSDRTTENLAAKSRSKIGLGTSKDRGLGEWQPFKFAYPDIEPCVQPLEDIPPLRNRHWKAGPYHTTMGIRNMPWNQWIEVDNEYERYHRIREHRVQTRGEKVIRVLDDAHNPLVKGGALAAVELVHEIAEYLCRRYPMCFRVTSRHSQRRTTTFPGEVGSSSLSPQEEEEYCDWGWDDAPPIKTIRSEATGETFELPLHIKDGENAPERALRIAALLVQDDLAIMIEGQDGKYYFQAGAILVAGFWRLEDKIGLPLEQIHTSGDVPFYREKLESSMARFFRRLAVDKPVTRSNYFVQVLAEEEKRDAVDPQELAWGITSNGPEDAFATHAHIASTSEVPVERLLVRSERQTLRRLGVSGAVIFTIRTYAETASGLGGTEDGYRLESALENMPAEVRHYKGADRGGWMTGLVGYLNRAKQ